MGTLATLLISLAGPMLARMLLSVGIGTVTFVGLTAAVNGLLSSARGASAGITGEVAQLVAMAGFFDAFGIASGALSGYLAWAFLKRFAVQA